MGKKTKKRGKQRRRMENKQGRIHGSLCRGRLGRGSNELGSGSDELGRGSNEFGRGSNDFGRGSNDLGRGH